MKPQCMICRRTLVDVGSLRRISDEGQAPAYACDDHVQEAISRFAGEHGVAALYQQIRERMARTVKRGDFG